MVFQLFNFTNWLVFKCRFQFRITDDLTLMFVKNCESMSFTSICWRAQDWERIERWKNSYTEMPAMDRGNIMRGWENKEPKQNFESLSNKICADLLREHSVFQQLLFYKVGTSNGLWKWIKKKKKSIFQKSCCEFYDFCFEYNWISINDWHW